MNIFALERRQKILLFFLCCATVALPGCLARVMDLLPRGLEYDEIWTYFKYSDQSVSYIFTELSLPNNHPLNSFLIKVFSHLTDYKSISVRAPVFISGILLIPLIGFITWRLSKDFCAVFLSIVFISCSGVAVHFSQTGRGYAIQTFFIMAYIASVIYYEQKKTDKSIIFLLTAFPSIVLATLTLPTTLYFIVPVIACQMIYIFHKERREGLKNIIIKNKSSIFLYVAVAAFWLFWYLFNFKDFSAQTAYGAKTTDLVQVRTFLFDIIDWLPGWPLAIISLSAFLARKSRPVAFAGLFVIAFPLLVGIFSFMGPMRAYMPLAAFFTIIGAVGLASLIDYFPTNSRKYLSIFFPALAAVVFSNTIYSDTMKWTPTDWKRVTPEIMMAFPKYVYISYPCADGYPIQFSCSPQVLSDNLERTAFFGLKFLNVKGKNISGMHIVNGGEVNIEYKGPPPMELHLAGESMYLYSMRKITEKPSSNVIIAVIRPMLMADAKELLYNITTADFLILNGYMTTAATDSGHLGYAFAIPLEKVDIERFKRLEEENKNISFYFLDGEN